MRKLRIGVIDLVASSPSKAWYARVMRANLAGIMPQVIAVWGEQAGHEVYMAYHAGYENMVDPLPDKLDLVFISGFTQSGQVAYALSNFYQSQGAITILGGPHARSYPEDAQQYFDYVVGFAHKSLILDLLQDPVRNRPYGVYLSSNEQPASLPGVQERWKFIKMIVDRAPLKKVVPMLGSLGCPYSCSFCCDSVVNYHLLDLEVMKEDLRFLLKKFKRPLVGWHDPNFGVRFDDTMNAIEEAIPPNSIDFIAESTLSLLTESNLKRLKQNGFKAALPGIETWFDMGGKSKARGVVGMERVRRVADHVNLVLSYLPYLQANFVLGLDTDEGPEPFELTKRFLELAPGAFPSFSLLTAFGRSAPLNLSYQRDNRIVGFPFHFLTNNHAMNVKPKNYTWPTFYDHVIDLYNFSFSHASIFHRFRANKVLIPRWLNVLRARSSEGRLRTRYLMNVRRQIDDPKIRRYFELETTDLPLSYKQKIQQALGPMWEWLPEGAIDHDPKAYLKSNSG